MKNYEQMYNELVFYILNESQNAAGKCMEDVKEAIYVTEKDFDAKIDMIRRHKQNFGALSAYNSIVQKINELEGN